MMDVWAQGDAYERYVGRWSRQLAPAFLQWAAIPRGAEVLDVGCGTGALSAAALWAGASRVVGIDRSEAFVGEAKRLVPSGTFLVGDAQALDEADAAFDAAVSGLVLNFVPEPARMASEMRRVVRPGGRVALYVWDYAGKMEMMRLFWDAASALDEGASQRDEAQRFPICAPGPLEATVRGAGLEEVEVTTLDQPTVFRDFDDYWTPFLGGSGPAPTYCTSLGEDARARLRERLRATLPVRPDGRIHLVARAFAVKGRVPA